MKFLAALAVTALLFVGCGPAQKSGPTTAGGGSGSGPGEEILKITNGTEPENVDPHVVTGVPEHHVINALSEGLVAEHPETLAAVPGTAHSWTNSADLKIWTFNFRTNALWSNGDRVTPQDFIASFERILNPKLASKYSYMLFVMKNAQAYNEGELTDFSEVGCKAIDDYTLEITLKDPTPYFLGLLNHYTWFPVHMATVEKHGDRYSRENTWTKPGNFVSNGAFRMKEWVTNEKLVVERSPTYWDVENVRSEIIHFLPIVSSETQEKLFRAGQIHNAYQLPPDKIPVYQKKDPHLLKITPLLSSYFYRFNTTKGPISDKRVRKALSMAIDRKAIVEHVTQAGQMPATFFTPPDTAGYTTTAGFKEDIPAAKKLLAEAGFPEGKGFPKVELLYNTDEAHRSVAEAIQEMWRKNLGVEVGLMNQEWKTYLDKQRQLNYFIARAGWNGDYVDPNTFLDMWTSWSQQNQTGWSNEKYDELIKAAGNTADMEKRKQLFDQAEHILMDELPVMPIYIYTRPYLLDPRVKGWYGNILDHHPWKHVYLSDGD
ncbi:MAG: peptide ABC transporter substrate-binding protein [Limisphaerales bacterium]